jgi:hypothetical protein
MKIEVRKLSATEYELEVEDAKLVPAKISTVLYQLLEQRTKNKSEFIRRVITEVLYRNVDLTSIRINENRNKVITFRIQRDIYNKMIEHAKRYETLNEFVNRALWWGVKNDSLYL